ncbi:MATE family efflux transporter [Ethanoligenens harbinense]|uniref:Probable multidrug resistance protein NorM n=1 Tax=Ethanoligenens harbinense (strain DSM 18485 / JCM 12961 / CGMCC 1.5033 / YUAN-3) TaxID=663278 RepID=E6U8D3_ETHHY|nr:MATE family efflux transporter [Ethanoligenens harbinense]ADU28252.1 MATE efflux family protein [Ethanoligenens harbinense YUAN-3]AVQ97248.1 MATE family efflux transporter [Ethanoligenens harbinense YUAN-3]AYF39913.1 MATE family efflux transporter [Ethanoligenens harbinense]AYF42743.1 MATE family efflux transporter [Ethanoligenens harbinense]QCN93493.1 MATE family efflux transporter [Ethanoligenens harbinense]
MTRNMKTGSPIKLIILFAFPLMIGNLCQQFYGIADTLIVGRTLGIGALAAVGSTASLSFLIIGFAQGVAAGLSIITAQRFGANDTEGVRKSAAVCLVVSGTITAIFTTFSVLFTRQILQLMNTPPDILDDAYHFIVIIFAGFGAAMLFNLLSSLILALGDSRTPLLFLMLASGLNVGLELFFILVLHMGVAGAGLATVLAQLSSCAGCLVYIVKRFPILRPRAGDWQPTRADLAAHLRVGLPMGFQNSIIAFGVLIIQFVLNGLGTTAVAAYSAAQKLDVVCMQPMIALGIAMATYAAQNYGAGKLERIRTGLRQCCVLSLSTSAAIGLAAILFGKQIVWLFVGNAPAVIHLAQIYFNCNCSLYFLLAALFAVRYTLQGVGKSFVPTAAGIMELGMRAVAAGVLARFLGFAGVSLSNPLAWVGSLSILIPSYLLVSRQWKRQAAQSPLCVSPSAAQPETNR